MTETIIELESGIKQPTIRIYHFENLEKFFTEKAGFGLHYVPVQKIFEGQTRTRENN